MDTSNQSRVVSPIYVKSLDWAFLRFYSVALAGIVVVVIDLFLDDPKCGPPGIVIVPYAMGTGFAVWLLIYLGHRCEIWIKSRFKAFQDDQKQ